VPKTAERCRLWSTPSWSVVTVILPHTREAIDPSPSLLAFLVEFTGLEADRSRRIAAESTVEMLDNRFEILRRQQVLEKSEWVVRPQGLRVRNVDCRSRDCPFAQGYR
jgi:hypothetical protein